MNAGLSSIVEMLELFDEMKTIRRASLKRMEAEIVDYWQVSFGEKVLYQ